MNHLFSLSQLFVKCNWDTLGAKLYLSRVGCGTGREPDPVWRKQALAFIRPRAKPRFVLLQVDFSWQQ